MATETVKGLFNSVSKEKEKLVQYSFDIVVAISTVLEKKQMTKTDLAKLLDKKPSEITKWFSGSHNFTLKTISLLSVKLDVDLIHVLGSDSLQSKDLIQKNIHSNNAGKSASISKNNTKKIKMS